MKPHHHTLPPDTGTFRHVLRMAIPLMLASSGHAIRLVADRIMLAKYSPETLAASMPAGLTSFVLMSFFIGTAGYVNTFVAQYSGAGRENRIGRAVWHAVYLSVIGGAIVAILSTAAPLIFRWMDHAPEVQVEQIQYFRILCWFSTSSIMLSALLSFWSGRGMTYVVMIVELICAVVNVILNYLLIYGHGGLPRLGIVGAAIGTCIASTVGLILTLLIFLSSYNRRTYGTARWPGFSSVLMKRLLRFGAPNGLHFMLDVGAFNVFVAVLGRFGKAELEATNMAFGLNACTFIPLLGLGMSVSILVGQCLGADNIQLAKRSVRNGMLLALIYVTAMGLLFLLAPELVLRPFQRAGDTAQIETLRIAARCIRYIALYLIFDAMYIIYSHAIRGAGDTRYAMFLSLALSWGTLVLPAFVAQALETSMWVLWRVFVIHVVLAGLLFWRRYQGGMWQTMRVIETTAVSAEIQGLENA